MLRRGEVVIRVLENVKQVTIKPLAHDGFRGGGFSRPVGRLSCR